MHVVQDGNDQTENGEIGQLGKLVSKSNQNRMEPACGSTRAGSAMWKAKGKTTPLELEDLKAICKRGCYEKRRTRKYNME